MESGDGIKELEFVFLAYLFIEDYTLAFMTQAETYFLVVII